MPLAVAALTFLLVVALIAGITWSFEGTRRVRQRLVTGPGAGFGVAADLLLTQATGGGRGGVPSKIARPARLPGQAGYPGPANGVLPFGRGGSLPRLLLAWLRARGPPR